MVFQLEVYYKVDRLLTGLTAHKKEQLLNGIQIKHLYQIRIKANNFEKAQAVVYNFLERPSGKIALCYHAVVFCFVFMCLALSVFATIEVEQKEFKYLCTNLLNHLV